MFQIRIEVRAGAGSVLIARPSRRAVIDDDDRSSALLYREAWEFAVGHTCSAEWLSGSRPGTAEMIATTWVPVATVHATSPAGSAAFQALYEARNTHVLAANWLAYAPADELTTALAQLPNLYSLWLDKEELRVEALPTDLKDQARRNISDCRQISRSYGRWCKQDMHQSGT